MTGNSEIILNDWNVEKITEIMIWMIDRTEVKTGKTEND